MAFYAFLRSAPQARSLLRRRVLTFQLRFLSSRHHRMSGHDGSRETFVTKNFSIYCYMQPWLTQKPVRPKLAKAKRTWVKNSADPSARASFLSGRSSVDRFRSTAASSWFYAAPVDLDDSLDTFADGATIISEASPASTRGQYQAPSPLLPSLNGGNIRDNAQSHMLPEVVEEEDRLAALDSSPLVLAPAFESPANDQNLERRSFVCDEESGSAADVGGGNEGGEAEYDEDSGDEDGDDAEKESEEGVKQLAYNLLHPDQQERKKDRVMSEDEFAEVRMLRVAIPEFARDIACFPCMSHVWRLDYVACFPQMHFSSFSS